MRRLVVFLLLAAPAAAQPGAGEVRELQRRAVQKAELEPGRLAALRRRLRLAPLLPTLRLRVARGTTDLQLLNLLDGSERIDRGDSWRAEAMAIWPLERLLFDPHEIALEREAERRAERRGLLTTEVAELYFERRGLEQALAEGALAAPARAEAALRVEELTAILEALTDGVKGSR